MLMALTLISLVWACSCWIFIKACGTPIVVADSGTLVTVLFGASSIALFILSFLVAVVATLGWQSLKDHISKNVSDKIKAKTSLLDGEIRNLENELRGRVATVLGHVIGEMSLKTGSFDVDEDDKDRLEHVVGLCIEGDKYLQKVGGAAAMLGLNNRIFYSCVLHEGQQKSRTDENFMLRGAQRLFEAGAENDVPMLLLTACRVFLEYGETSEEKERARKMLRDLEARVSRISDREKKEAAFYLDKYPEISLNVNP